MRDEDRTKEELLKELKELRLLVGESGQAVARTSCRPSGEEKIIFSGIAHEFNNVLTAIVGNILLAKMYARPESEVFDILTEAEKASLRAGDLTGQLLSFSECASPSVNLQETGEAGHAASRREKNVPAGRKWILVMDDEEIVRNVVDRMLNQCSCDAVFAREGSEMVDAYRRQLETGRPFDAVIVDLIVDVGMGGREAIERLLEVDPHARAVVSSGFYNDPVMADFRKFGFRGVLPKPYNISDLDRVLQEVIAR